MKKNTAKNALIYILCMCSIVLEFNTGFLFANAESCGAGQQYGDYAAYKKNPNDVNGQKCKYYQVVNLGSLSNDYATNVAMCQEHCNDYVEDGYNCFGFNVPQSDTEYQFNSCQICGYSYLTDSNANYDWYMRTTLTGCHDCPYSTYKSSAGTAQCIACPAGSITEQIAADSVSDCRCNVGFTGPDGGPCSTCAAGSYKSTVGSAVCDTCAAGEHVRLNYQAYEIFNEKYCYYYAESYFSWTVEQCAERCDALENCQAFSYDSRPDWLACTICSNTEQSDGVQYDFYLKDGQPADGCYACPVGKYNTDAVECVDCPENSFTLTTGSTSCKCDVGFTGADGGSAISCSQCTAGKYKDTIGSATCSNCNSGYVSNAEYSGCIACEAGKYEESDVCNLCGAYSNSVAGSTTCFCNAGAFGPAGGPCQLCAVGKYKNIAGTSLCIDCGVGTVALTEGRTSCQNCVAGTYYTSSTLCTNCHEHSTSPSGAQTINDCYCVANYYKSSSSTCSTCPAFSTSPAGSDDVSECLCNPGYEFQSVLSTCEQCFAGYYKPSAGNVLCDICLAGTYGDQSAATECLNCAAGKYSSQNGASICTDCPDFSISVAASDAIDDCKCNAGYSGDSQNCLACDFGKYKSNSGSQACIDCPASKTSISQANVDESSCICDVGFGLDQEQNCVACEAGKYKSAQDNSLCLECAMAKYQDQSQQSSCDDCTPDSTTETTGKTSALHCLCNSGYTLADSSCSLCVDGFFKSFVGNDACIECELGHDSATDRQSCIPCKANEYLFDDGDQVHICMNCPTNSKSDEASEGVLACLCDAGYERVFDFQCEACALGFTKSTAGNEMCVPCAAGTYINYLASTACLPCQTYSYSTEASSKCNCNAGYVEDSVDGSIACIPCAVGKIATASSSTLCEDCAVGKYNAEQAATVCSQCLANSVTLQSASTSESECLCNAGYTRDASGVCVACAANFYKSSVSDEDCINCPENTFSEQGTISELDCGCNSGYTNNVVMNVSVCEACENGKYKVHVGSGECLNCQVGKYSSERGKTSANDCIACPLNSITLLDGSASIQSCICNAGYVKFNLSNVSSEFQCNACEIGKYSEIFFTVCERCVGNTTTLLIGTDSIEKCVCNAGYAFNSDFDSGTNEKCVACQAGKYKPVVANSLCSKCETGKYSNEIGQTNESYCKLCFDNSKTVTDGSTSIGQCLCNAGYTDVSQQINSSVFERCEPCAIDTFKAQLGNTVCEPCAFNAFSVTGSIRCECNDGFYVPGISATELNGVDCILNPYMHYMFASSGQLDDQNSCKIQCEDGYYRTSNRNSLKCRAHTHSSTHECPENHFLIVGTYYADAECRACKLCYGKQILNQCNKTHDTVCTDCIEDVSIGFSLSESQFLPAFARFVNTHGSACKLGCLNGLILNKLTKQCEVCLDLCQPGYFFPTNRQNCTHCEKCATVLPQNAQYVSSEDRVDCEWTCVHGFQLEHGECVKTIHSSLNLIEATTLGSEFDDASICTGHCHEPGCIIHNGKCISCYELPEDHPIIKTLSTPENELMKHFANSNPLLIDSRPPHGKHRWAFTGSSCRWNCLMGWSKIKSEDLSHFKCEATSNVNHLLRTTNQKNAFAGTEVEVQQDVSIIYPSTEAQNNSQKNVTIVMVSDDSVLITGLVLFALPVLLLIIVVLTKLILLCSNK